MGANDARINNDFVVFSGAFDGQRELEFRLIGLRQEPFFAGLVFVVLDRKSVV